MLRRHIFLILSLPLLITIFGETAKGQGWTFQATVTQTGQCIPVPPTPYDDIAYSTQSACETARQMVLDGNGEDWSLYGDGSCTTIITCTPCTGSDIGGGTGSSSGLASPGTLSLDGLTRGSAFFSAHPSKDVENWIYDYLQRMNSMGIPVDGVTLITPADVPLTGNNEFNRFYAEQMMRFEKPEKGGVVYLNEGTKGIVDPNRLKMNEDAAVTDFKGDKTVAETGLRASNVPLPGSVPEYWGNYEMNMIESAGSGIDGNAHSGASWNEKTLELLKMASGNEYAEWVGNLTGAICSNISEVANILGNPEATDLSSEDQQRYDATTALYKASIKTVTDGLIGKVSDKAVKGIEYLGEKASIRIYKDIDPEIIKAEYKDYLDLGKVIIKVSDKASKVWGVVTK